MSSPTKTARALASIVVTIAACSTSNGTAFCAHLDLVATTQDVASIARAVGGERVEVYAIAKGYQDPHYVAAKPSYMVRANRADLVAYNGLQLEIGWLPLLLRGARNSQIMPGAKGDVDISDGIRVLEVPTAEATRAAGDVHPEGNPHYSLDPRNGAIMARTFAARLSLLDPDGAIEYRRNLDGFETDLATRVATWEQRLAKIRGRSVVCYHQQWEYLLDWLDLKRIGLIEEKPGIPPAPRHLAELVDKMKQEGAGLVIHSDFVDPKAAQAVARRAGVPVLELPASVESRDRIKTYFDLFEHIVAALEKVEWRE
ncbi:MAG: ABC transporter substrate-binding protein, partial [Gemmatimonadetes bacterium]|nr:ABC transporter substrate-binding protein [Gemmatimonadota bacterium]